MHTHTHTHTNAQTYTNTTHRCFHASWCTVLRSWALCDLFTSCLVVFWRPLQALLLYVLWASAVRRLSKCGTLKLQLLLLRFGTPPCRTHLQSRCCWVILHYSTSPCFVLSRNIRWFWIFQRALKTSKWLLKLKLLYHLQPWISILARIQGWIP